MKTNHLGTLFSIAIAALSLQRASAQPLDLSLYTTGGAGFYTNTFDGLGYTSDQTVDGTPTGTKGSLSAEWACYVGATANFFGTLATGAPNVSSPGSLNNWTNSFNGGFFNYASYFDYIGGTNFYTNNFPIYTNAPINYGVITNPTYQTNEPNRCLGIRQIGAFGDPGASFVLKLANTMGYHNFKLAVDLLNLDPTSPRMTTWHIQYGVADPVVGVPAAFQDLPGLASLFNNYPGSNHWKTVRINIPDGTIDNIDGQVWLRFVTLNTSSGSGNRETFAIDNFGLTWTNGAGICTPVTNNPIGIFMLQPPAPPVYSNATVELQASGGGSQPQYYQWLFNGQDVGAVFPNQVLYQSQRSSILTLQNLTTANQGNYSCIVSNFCGGTVYSNISPDLFIAVSNLTSVNFGYLRTLTDQNYNPTASPNQYFQATGMITTVTNTTSGNTSSYYIQDDTGGMNIFVTGGATFRPQLGDVVTVAGYLNGFQGNLEIEADMTSQNPTFVQILSNNIANYPAPKLLDWATEFAVGVTNPIVERGTTNNSGQLTGLGSKKGSICILRDVYFGTNAGKGIFGNFTVYVTNSAGLGGYLLFWGGFDQDVRSNTLPAYAYSVQGPLLANIVSGNGSFWSGIGVSKWLDVVTTPFIVQASWATNTTQLTWVAVPETWSYTVLAAPAVTGPFAPLATGLRFANTNGVYLDQNATGQQKFYRLTSP